MRSFVLALAVWAILAPGTVPALTELAITVDDLPTHGAISKGTGRLEIARHMVDAFKKHRVREAYGFVNGKQVQENPELLPVLQEWVLAGFPLANHTFSHFNLDRVTPGEYVADIEENARFLVRFPPASSFRPFRYPYLAERDSLDKRDAVRALLGAKGYRIAQTTVYFRTARPCEAPGSAPRSGSATPAVGGALPVSCASFGRSGMALLIPGTSDPAFELGATLEVIDDRDG